MVTFNEIKCAVLASLGEDVISRIKVVSKDDNEKGNEIIDQYANSYFGLDPVDVIKFFNANFLDNECLHDIEYVSSEDITNQYSDLCICAAVWGNDWISGIEEK